MMKIPSLKASKAANSVGLQVSSHVVYNAKYVNAIDSSVIVQAVLSNDKVSKNIEKFNL